MIDSKGKREALPCSGYSFDLKTEPNMLKSAEEPQVPNWLPVWKGF